MPAAVRHVLITPARSLPASTITSCMTAYGLDPDATCIVTSAALTADGTLGEPHGSVDKLVSLGDGPAWHASPKVLAALQASLKPGGTLVTATLTAPPKSAAAAHQELLVAGFADAKASACAVVGVGAFHVVLQSTHKVLSAGSGTCSDNPARSM